MSQLEQQILAAFTGANHEALARQFNTTTAYVYRVTRRSDQAHLLAVVQGLLTRAVGKNAAVLWAGPLGPGVGHCEPPTARAAVEKAISQASQNPERVAAVVLLPTPPTDASGSIPAAPAIEPARSRPGTPGPAGTAHAPSDAEPEIPALQPTHLASARHSSSATVISDKPQIPFEEIDLIPHPMDAWRAALNALIAVAPGDAAAVVYHLADAQSAVTCCHDRTAATTGEGKIIDRLMLLSAAKLIDTQANSICGHAQRALVERTAMERGLSRTAAIRQLRAERRYPIAPESSVETPHAPQAMTASCQQPTADRPATADHQPDRV